eukprot:755832-Hanusia_phi.AAC.1
MRARCSASEAVNGWAEEQVLFVRPGRSCSSRSRYSRQTAGSDRSCRLPKNPGGERGGGGGETRREEAEGANLEVCDAAVGQDCPSLYNKILHVELPPELAALLIDCAAEQLVQAGVKGECFPDVLGNAVIHEERLFVKIPEGAIETS